MASASLCFSGFSRDEITLIHKQFEQANAELAHSWTLASEADAHVLVIDMDSMYGHMTWLKAHSSGKITVGMTAGERSETDYLLKRPLSAVALKAVLGKIAAAVAERPRAAIASAAPVSAPASAPAPAAPAAASPPVPAAPAPAAPANFAGPSADYLAAVTTGQMAAMPLSTVPHEPRVSDYLPKGILGGPAKLQLAGGPLLAFDPATQTYAGSATLKPLLPYVEAIIRDSDFTAIEAAEFERIKAGSGGAQPYMRLLWLCGLTVCKGQLLPGFSLARKFVLTKWPQIEREFPKHFRLATVMMKGPAFAKDIAELAGVTQEDVVDFINAGLLAGSVVVEGSTSTAGDVDKACALLAKPRAG